MAARRRSRTFTEVELEFMNIVWELGEATSEQVRSALRDKGTELTDGSVRKVLSILEAKGHIERHREGRGFIYSAIVHRTDANRSMVMDLLGRAFDGSALLLVASLLDSRNISSDDMEKIEKLIAEHKKKNLIQPV
ncbi:BlaI/MecI/CopY family transcriptional regulator [bacterium]|nr:BlaI/MecI/CopY family transcriptional regulator [bacterium]